MAVAPAPAIQDRLPASHPLARSGSVAVDRAVLFAGHAECPCCGAYVRRLTQLGDRSTHGELVEGWCSVCCTSTLFLMRT